MILAMVTPFLGLVGGVCDRAARRQSPTLRKAWRGSRHPPRTGGDTERRVRLDGPIMPIHAVATQARLAPAPPRCVTTGHIDPEHCSANISRICTIAGQARVRARARLSAGTAIPCYQACAMWQWGHFTVVETGARNTQPHWQA